MIWKAPLAVKQGCLCACAWNWWSKTKQMRVYRKTVERVFWFYGQLNFCISCSLESHGTEIVRIFVYLWAVDCVSSISVFSLRYFINHSEEIKEHKNTTTNEHGLIKINLAVQAWTTMTWAMNANVITEDQFCTISSLLTGITVSVCILWFLAFLRHLSFLNAGRRQCHLLTDAVHATFGELQSLHVFRDAPYEKSILSYYVRY